VEIFSLVIAVLAGTVIASFLGVCIDRLPKKESIISPASHCTACEHPLGTIDLIPVFSYLWRRGRCHYCQATIPRRLFWLEIGMGALFAFLYWRYGLTFELVVTALYCSLFILLMFIDLDYGIIPNVVVYPSALVALLISIFLPQPGIARSSGAIGGGIGLGLFVLIILASRGGMGWGDAKMAALIGLVTGFPLVFVALFLAIVSGGLTALLLLSFKIKKRKESVPFAPFLSLATIATLLWGKDMVAWYLRLL